MARSGYDLPGADAGFMELIAQAATTDAIERERAAYEFQAEALYLDDREARAAWYAAQEEVRR